MKNAMTATIAAAPMTPPTTPPAIAPAFELLPPRGVEVEVEVEANDEPDADLLGVIVDWKTWIDEGTMEVVPVTSGVSPVALADEMFQLSPIDVSI